MSWNRNSLIAAVAAGMLSGVAMADTLVVRSAGPSAALYPPGKSLPEGASVTLKAGDQLVLLDGRGTRIVRGPASFSSSAAAASPATGARFAALVGGGTDRRVRIGAVRGVPTGAPRSPSIWYVDATKGGTVCVSDPASLTLWRPDAAEAAQIAVAGGRGPATRLSWPAGSNTLAWPAALPVAQGGQYVLTSAGAPPVKVRFAMLGARPSGLEDTATSLIRSGCTGQLDLLVDTFSLPGADAAPAG